MTATGCWTSLVSVNMLPAVSMHLNNAAVLINMLLVIRKQHANHYHFPRMIQKQSQYCLLFYFMITASKLKSSVL